MTEKKHFRETAKAVIDLFFKAKFFKSSVSRDDMKETEDFLTLTLEKSHELSVGASELLDRFKSYQEEKTPEITIKFLREKHPQLGQREAKKVLSFLEAETTTIQEKYELWKYAQENKV